MSAIAGALRGALDLRQGLRVSALVRRGGGWEVLDERGASLGRFERALVTAPPPQAAELLGGGSPLAGRAAGLRLRPCWAVVLGLAAPYEVPFDGAFCDGLELSWVARNSSKPGRPPGEAWVLHGAPGWSEQHLAAGPAEVIERLTRALERLTGVPLPPLAHRGAHRWCYALPDPPLEEGCLVDAERGLVLAGDALGGGRVEGAFLSGLAAAEALTEPGTRSCT
jgi:predicted NAD/FAD-dependent oxidoreductase